MPCLWPAHIVPVLHRTRKHSSRNKFMLYSHQILAGTLPSALQEDDTMLVYWLNLQLNSGWIKKSILSPREIDLLSCLHTCRLCVLFLCSQTLYSWFKQQNSNPQHLQTTLNNHQQEPTQVMQPPVTVFQTSNCLHVMCSWTKSAHCIFRINPHTPRVCRWSPKLSQIHSCTRVK